MNSLQPSNPFILHFLLDGFVTNHIGNDNKSARAAMVNMLRMIAEENEETLKKIATDYIMEIKSGDEDSIPSIITPILIDNIEIQKEKLKRWDKDMIITGGTNKHAISFRFLKKTRRIVLINTGEGLLRYHSKHPRHKHLFQLYKNWQFRTDDEFEEVANNVRAAIYCKASTSNINEVYDFQVPETSPSPIKWTDELAVPDSKYNQEEEKARVDSEIKTNKLGELLWLTNEFNYKWDKGNLYARPQINGSCSFHSLFWQLLLGTWESYGAEVAKKFEWTCRRIVLEKMLIKESKVSENISCLQLLVRVYRDFRGRDKILETLLLVPDNTRTWKDSPIVTQVLPVTIVKESKAKQFLRNIEQIRNSNNIIDAISLLELALANVLAVVDSIKVHDKKTALYRFTLVVLIGMSIRHISNNIAVVLPTTVYQLRQSVRCAAKYVSLLRHPMIKDALLLFLPVDEAQEEPLREFTNLFFVIVGQLHSNLPPSVKLPPHAEPYPFADYVIFQDSTCAAYDFIKDYYRYAPVGGILYSQQTEWKKYTNAEIDKWHGTEFFQLTDSDDDRSSLMRAYHYYDQKQSLFDFISTNQVGECIAALFVILCSMCTNPDGLFKKIEIKKPVPLIKRLVFYREESPSVFDHHRGKGLGVAGFVAELAKTDPLSFLPLTSLLPTHYQLSINCHAIKMPDACVCEKFSVNKDDPSSLECSVCFGKNRVDLDGSEVWSNMIGPLVNPALFFQLRLDWAKAAWVNVAPQIPTVTDPTALLSIAIWLLYLWPRGPPVEISKYLLQVSADGITSSVLRSWCSLDNAEPLAEQVLGLLLLHAPPPPNSEQWLLVKLFAGTLFYRSNTGQVIQNFSHQAVQEGSYALSDDYLWPADLLQLTWPGSVPSTEITYKDTAGLFLVVCKDNADDGYFKSIYTDCVKKRVICTLWKKNMKSADVLLKIHFGKVTVQIKRTKKEAFLQTPSGDTYQIALPTAVPECMRQWCQDYRYSVALPLQQDGKWFLFLCGVHAARLARTVFDSNESKPVPPYKGNAAAWYIYPMHDCAAFIPVLTRFTTGWYFLLENLITSVKQSCIELLRKTFTHIKEYNPTDETRGLENEEWPTTMSFYNRTDRQMYMAYLAPEFDPSPLTTAATQSDIWRYLSTVIDAKEVVNRNWRFMLPVLYETLEKKYDPESYKPEEEHRQLFEVASGLIMNENQVNLMQTLNSSLDGTAMVQTALMGIGKSKVLVPVLSVARLRRGEKVLVVQPGHLVPQTDEVLDKIIPLLDFKRPPQLSVQSDVAAKKQYAEIRRKGEKFDSDRSVIFDEVDGMYNCFTSEYNIPDTDSVAHPLLTNSSFPLNRYYKLVVDSCYGALQEEDEKFWKNWSGGIFYKKFMTNFDECKQKKLNYQYGLAKGRLLAVPYSAVNTPVIGSSFSDIDVAAILTCLVRKAQGLSVEDLHFLDKRLHQIMMDFGAHLVSQQLVQSLRIDDENRQKLYLACILLPDQLRAFSKQYNVSFIDLMESGFAQRRFGFSGTSLMLIPQFHDHPWDPNIAPDVTGDAKIQRNIKGGNAHVLHYTSFQQLCKRLKQYDVLIDAGALLREQGSALAIVKEWAKADDSDYTYVFINDDHEVREYTPSDTTAYRPYKFSSDRKFKWYFDQRHTVGIDLTIADNAKGLVLIAPRSKLADVAQAIYRMRGINKGKQTVSFMLESKCTECATDQKCSKLDQHKLYDLLLSNNNKFLQDVKGRHSLQNFKTVVRSLQNYSQEYYSEPVRYSGSESTNAIIPDYSYVADDLTRRLKDAVKTKELQFSNSEDTQIEQQRQTVASPIIEFIDCFEGREIDMTLTNLKDYESTTWGLQLTNVNLSVSLHVVQMLRAFDYKTSGLIEPPGLREQMINFCFLLLPNTHCRVITIAEMFLLQSKSGQKVGDQVIYRTGSLPGGSEFVFRKDVIPENASPQFLLAMALCGRVLSFDKQLQLIQSIPVDAFKALGCFQLQSELFTRYLKDSTLIETIKKMSYAEFTSLWVTLPLPDDILKPYYQHCLDILK